MARNQRDDVKTILTTPLTTITHTDPTDDMAWSNVTTSSPYGLANQDEANSVLKAVRINQLRLLEIENALKEAGILN